MVLRFRPRAVQLPRNQQNRDVFLTSESGKRRLGGKIDLLSLAIASAVGITMAQWELGYWALVGMIVSGPLVSTAGAWLAVRWLPGMPSRGSGVRSMLHFGGTVSCNIFVVYMVWKRSSWAGSGERSRWAYMEGPANSQLAVAAVDGRCGRCRISCPVPNAR
jgi:Polysaccharide biosynthesis protein